MRRTSRGNGEGRGLLGESRPRAAPHHTSGRAISRSVLHRGGSGVIIGRGASRPPELPDTERCNMSTRVRWLGHSALLVDGGGPKVLIDPFLTGNPKAAAKA